MEDGGVLLPHKLLHEFLLLFFHQVFTPLYQPIQGGIDDLQGGRAPPLSRDNGTKERNVPIGDKRCAAVLCFTQTGIHRLQTKLPSLVVMPVSRLVMMTSLC